MRILINNYLEDADLTINNPSDAFPEENIINNSPKERVQFDNYIVIDLGSAKNVKSVGFLNISDAITLEGNATDSWGTPTFSQVLTDEVTFIDETFRYWRIYTGALASRVGYFYLGLYLQMNGDDGTHVPQKGNNDVKEFTSSGALFPVGSVDFINEIYKYPLVTEAEKDSFELWWDTLDRVNNHFIIPFENSLVKYPPYFGNVIDKFFERNFAAWLLEIKTRETK